MSDGGKGSKPRPIPDRARYESEFDRIFNNGMCSVHGSQDAPSQEAGPEQVQAPIPHAATEARG